MKVLFLFFKLYLFNGMKMRIKEIKIFVKFDMFFVFFIFMLLNDIGKLRMLCYKCCEDVK